jgi:hypothetical protein
MVCLMAYIQIKVPVQIFLKMVFQKNIKNVFIRKLL